MTAFYDAVAPHYDALYTIPDCLNEERMRAVLDALALPAGARILDLGIGTGRALPYLERAGFDVTGVDSSPAMLAICRTKHPRATLIEADVFGRLPFDDGSFGGAIGLHGLLSHAQHPQALRRLSRELARLLGPEGVVVFEEAGEATLGPSSGVETPLVRGCRRGPRGYEVSDITTGQSFTFQVWDRDTLVDAFAEWRLEFRDTDSDERLIVGTRRHGDR